MAVFNFEPKHGGSLPVLAGARGESVDAAPIADAFSNIRAWTDAAVNSGEKSTPDIGPLQQLLPNRYRSSLLPPKTSQETSEGLIAFAIEGGIGVGIKTRYVLPVHFVTMRALDLIPGVAIAIKDETKGSDKIRQRNRPLEDKIFRVNLNVKTRQQGLGRFLFHVPPDAELHERRTKDEHRFIIPKNHVITKFRKETPPISQEKTLSEIADILKKARPLSLAYSGKLMMDTLTTLLAIGDTWHWDDLEGRLKGDARREI